MKTALRIVAFILMGLMLGAFFLGPQFMYAASVDLIRTMTLTKLLVLAVALSVAVVYAERIVLWYRAAKDGLQQGAAVGLVAGLMGWLCSNLLLGLGNWFIPNTFGRDALDIKTLAACALTAALAVSVVRNMDAKKDTRSPEQRAIEAWS